MSNPKILAVIPARGGSKRFPKKNLARLGNKTLLEYSIDFAMANSDLITKTVVSTDDNAIAEMAQEFGVETIRRPDDISGDHSPTSQAVKHALSQVAGDFDLVLTLQPTNPLRPDGILENAIKILESGECDSVFTVQLSHRKLGYIEGERFRGLNYSFGQRSQDMRQAYYETGLLYLTKSELIEQGVIFGPKLKPMIVDHPFSEIDIDIEQDLKKAEFYIKNYSDESTH